MRVLLSLFILGSSVLHSAQAWADFEVLEVSLTSSIQNREPAAPVSPAVHCEKDKNGQSDLPVVNSLARPKIFFWTRIASSSKGVIRHTWHQHLEDGWETIAEVNLPIKPSPGYRMWSSKALHRGNPIGDWMIVVAPSHDPERVLCITRFSVK
ncbi:MAG: hypothetical protein NPIRA05_07650 [Nitrospirales bacterium]|nr:MAG: hypothetical protein NPIRA05_07650 [Nitrospirales bacterium]